MLESFFDISLEPLSTSLLWWTRKRTHDDAPLSHFLSSLSLSHSISPYQTSSLMPSIFLSALLYSISLTFLFPQPFTASSSLSLPLCLFLSVSSSLSLLLTTLVYTRLKAVAKSGITCSCLNENKNNKPQCLNFNLRRNWNDFKWISDPGVKECKIWSWLSI